jgi:hypothetical protein
MFGIGISVGGASVAIAVIAGGFGASALAADMPTKAPVYKAPVAALPYNWSGPAQKALENPALKPLLAEAAD